MPAQIQFDAQCQSCRQDNGTFTMLFNPGDNQLPSAWFYLPKEYPPCERGRKYRITIEPAPADRRLRCS